MKKILAVSLLVICFLLPALYAADFTATISLLSGSVEVKTAGSWKKAEKNMTLSEKDEIRTGAGGRVVLTLSDGSRMNLQENSELVLNTLAKNNVQVALNSGTMNTKVKKMGAGGKFSIDTPASVCAVRGTSFKIKASEKDTSVECYRGSVGVGKKDTSGEVFVSRWEKILVSQDQPLGNAITMNKEERNVVLAPVVNEMSQEVRMGMSREAVQAAAAQEIKKAEYQQGKSLIDAFGKRVRLEEYIVRPLNPDTNKYDQFKLVALTERENRYDYLTWKATFNDTLPTNLKDATKWLDDSKWGATKPTYWLTKNESAISNTVDVMEWNYTDGHVEYVSGTWEHFFDNYKWQIVNTNGTFEKLRWTGTNLTSYNNRTWYLSGDLASPYTNNQFTAWLISNVKYSGPASTSDELYFKYELAFPNSKNYSEEYYFVDNDGNRLTYDDIVDSNTGNYKNYDWNEEMVLKADEFIGPDKKIDLVIEPKIFQDAGIGIPE